MNNQTSQFAIREEEEKDFKAISRLLEEAFAKDPHSDHQEAILAERLRGSASYIRQLSLVAIANGKVVGYLMMSKAKVGEETALALAPLAVLPFFQKQGIGTSLVETAHEIASKLGYSLSLVLGEPLYYSRFGYKPSTGFGIKSPFDVPEENYMAISLNGQTKIYEGKVVYGEAFG